MEALVQKYADKLIKAGLADSSGLSQPLIGGIDDILVWNREAEETTVLEKVFQGLNINSLVFLRPSQPYASLIKHLSDDAFSGNGLIEPKDCETRTFLHDLPVINQFDADQIISILKKRKSVIISSIQTMDNPAILAHGTVSPEQGFVTVSSVCFASFVKFFTDYLEKLRRREATARDHNTFDSILPHISDFNTSLPEFIKYPFKNEETVYSAIIEAGKKTIEYGLVDSYFGNLSYLWKNTLYISQTSSSLDELAGCIDPVPLDNSTSAGLTASSELTAHLKTLETSGCRAILHGHPRFCVILSMDCDPVKKANCKYRNQCHIKCPEKRSFKNIPIVPGEVGTGPAGLCNTLPAALHNSDSAIVYGHGLFTTGKKDFYEAFQTMLDVEVLCQKYYFNSVNKLRSENF